MEKQLDILARRFRGTRDLIKRRAIADEYAIVVDALIDSGKWNEAPNFDEMLTNEYMPANYWAYWKKKDASKPRDDGSLT